ncbi:MAG: phosphoglycerate dehydrogenase [Rhodospirillaceae bacterium]|nr:phosphoglycerate dehydrogenase [Rhodospirillaceae bacterium]|tara:strand:- start:375 stop:1328 length:954 start_codon:yes stop_codon:yes gene_type:complete
MFKQLGVSATTPCTHPVMRQIILDAYPEARIVGEERITEEDRLIEFLTGCDAAIVGFEPLTDKVLTALPELKVVSKFGAGCETIDFDALKAHEIRFGYTFGVNKLSVAELTLSFMISALRWITPLNQSMRAGDRPRYRNGELLTGRTVGIHGCGNIGKEVARLLKPFNCTILSCDVKDYPEFYAEYDIVPVSFDELLERSEVLTLHLPKTQSTRGLYTREVLQRMRPEAVLINTCRGEIVDEDALADRLQDESLRAACFDVFAIEPAANDRLLNLPNFLATPHIGASTEETRVAMAQAALRGLTENELVEPEKYYDN